MPPVVLEFLDLIVLHTRPRMTPAPLFSDEELGRLSMPVLLVGGEKDALRDCRAIAGRLRGVVPRLESILLPEAGHALVKVGSVVEPFLRLG
jgi:acetyl esterase/lipase